MSNKELSKLLSANQELVYTPETGKVKCSLSGHEMPYQLDALQSYIQGKKYRKLLSEKAYDYEKYKVHLVPSMKKGREHQLFCLLTLRHLNNSPHHIDVHINGRRFKKALEKWEECQRKGIKFQPNKGQKKKREFSDWEEEMEVDKGSDDTDDSMSDLYPVADFTIEENEDSDYDMDGAEPAPAEGAVAGQTETTGTKRKSTLPTKTTKKKSKLKKKKKV